jgi:hypothetical protein
VGKCAIIAVSYQRNLKYMMNYNYHYGSYGAGWDGMMNANPFFLPFFFAGAVVVFILALIWIAVVIWALVDLFKHKPPHTVAWAFVIILGKIMGPVGYYFIVVRDRMMKNKPATPTPSETK